MDETTDAALVARALAGRREAFAVLVRRYQDHAYGTAVGMLTDFDLARDVVQEAFLNAYRDLPKLREPARFAPWLHGIVRNVARRALRELARVQAMARELSQTVEPVCPAPAPDESAAEAERRRIVREALGRLGQRNREAVSLHYVDGLSYADIAAYLGVTETTVQGRCQRGRAQLRKELLKMVADAFKADGLGDDFAARIERLLDRAAAAGPSAEAAVKRLAEFGPAAVDLLCKALGDSRMAVRRAAAWALCAIGDARALRPILQALYSKEDYWAHNALLRTGRGLGIPGLRDELLAIVRRDDPRQRYSAMLALAHAAGDDEVYDCVLEAFRDPAYSDRTTALAALCRLRPESAAERITEALRDPKLRRHGYVSWLALARGCLIDVDVCLDALDAQQWWHGRVALGLLVLRHGPAGRQALRRLLSQGTRRRRAMAAAALADGDDLEAFRVLREELLSGRGPKKWRRHVAHVLGRKYARALAESAKGQGGGHEVLWALARGEPGAGAGLAQKVGCGGAPAAGAAAVRILARHKGAAMLPELRRLLRAGKPRKLAQEAFRQMLRLRDAAETDARDMLTSPHWPERKAGVCLLRRWGKLTVQDRARAKKDPHVAVRQAAG